MRLRSQPTHASHLLLVARLVERTADHAASIASGTPGSRIRFAWAEACSPIACPAAWMHLALHGLGVMVLVGGFATGHFAWVGIGGGAIGRALHVGAAEDAIHVQRQAVRARELGARDHRVAGAALAVARRRVQLVAAEPVGGLGRQVLGLDRRVRGLSGTGRADRGRPLLDVHAARAAQLIGERDDNRLRARDADRARGISCLAERRMIETIDQGKPVTPFMKFGDRIRIEKLGEVLRRLA